MTTLSLGSVHEEKAEVKHMETEEEEAAKGWGLQAGLGEGWQPSSLWAAWRKAIPPGAAVKDKF